MTTKISSFIIFITISSLALSALVASQADSCSSNLNLNGQVSFDTTSLHCLPVWDAHGYFLRYTQASTNSNIWSFVLSVPADTNSFVAMGFSSNGMMVGSSAVVGWISDGGTGAIKQYYLGGQSSSRVEPDQGNLTFVQNSASVVTQSNRLYLAFQLDTVQPATRLLYSVGPSGFRPVAPGYRLMEHRDKVSTSINYLTGQSASQNPHQRLRRTHGILNMLGWGILMIIGSIVARYGRQWDPLWFYVHMGIQSFGFLLGVIGVLCGFLLDNRIDADVSTHKGLGIFIFVLGCLQAMALLARPNKASKNRKYWNWYHYGVGRTLLVFAIANIFYGIHLGDEGTGWIAGYAVVVCVLFVTSAVLEYRIWVRNQG